MFCFWVFYKGFFEMTTAVAEENAVDVVAGGDSVESMLENFDLGDVAGADAVPDAGAEESAGEAGTDHEKPLESGEPTGETGSTDDCPLADPPATADEVLELRRQVDRLSSELSMRQFSDREISAQSARVRELSDEVRGWESQVKEAKGELTATKERYESAVRELRAMLDDRSRGQKRFPLEAGGAVAAVNGTAPAETPAKTDETPVITECVIDGNTQNSIPAAPDEHASSPISVLAQKQMIAAFGQDAWEAAKNREEPFGMGKAELESLEAADLTTIGELEKRMREDAWWHQKLPKFGEKKVAKLIESLRVWRGKFPMPV